MDRTEQGDDMNLVVKQTQQPQTEPQATGMRPSKGPAGAGNSALAKTRGKSVAVATTTADEDSAAKLARLVAQRELIRKAKARQSHSASRSPDSYELVDDLRLTLATLRALREERTIIGAAPAGASKQRKTTKRAKPVSARSKKK